MFVSARRRATPKQQYKTWIKPLKLATIDEISVNTDVLLLAPNRFIRDWVLDKFISRITEILQQLSGERCTVKVESSLGIELSNPPGSDEKPAAQPQVITSKPFPATTSIKIPSERTGDTREGSLNHKSYLNSNFTFDSFVEGKSNQLALAAARQISENPGGSYNPLFIYGAVGLGKNTLNACGWQ